MDLETAKQMVKKMDELTVEEAENILFFIGDNNLWEEFTVEETDELANFTDLPRGT